MARDGEDPEVDTASLAVACQRRHHQQTEPARSEHRDRLAGPRCDGHDGAEARGKGLDQQRGLEGNLRRQGKDGIDRRQNPRAEAAGKIVNAQNQSLGAVAGQSGRTEGAVVPHAARVVRCVDLHHVVTAFGVVGHELVTRDLGQREGQEVSVEVRRADPAAVRPQRPVAGAQTQVFPAVAVDGPSPLGRADEAVLRLVEAAVGAVLGRAELVARGSNVSCGGGRGRVALLGGSRGGVLGA